MKPPQDEIPKVECKGEDTVLKLSVGDEFYYQFHRHGSVGIDAEFEIEDNSILAHTDSETEYLHPEHMKKPGWTGGDAEKGKWFFKALKPGGTTLKINILFRFEVESTCTLTIVVES
ncbi:MAG: hypothetical protein MUP60_02280 [Candidatus Thorarchaeota archaeon]|nr:hypothetical protein [Candidatus Thorarchaeota archaeon]